MTMPKLSTGHIINEAIAAQVAKPKPSWIQSLFWWLLINLAATILACGVITTGLSQKLSDCNGLDCWDKTGDIFGGLQMLLLIVFIGPSKAFSKPIWRSFCQLMALVTSGLVTMFAATRSIDALTIISKNGTAVAPGEYGAFLISRMIFDMIKAALAFIYFVVVLFSLIASICCDKQQSPLLYIVNASNDLNAVHQQKQGTISIFKHKATQVMLPFMTKIKDIKNSLSCTGTGVTLEY